MICTLSEKRCSKEFIASLYEKGMDVVRINSAHASLEGAQAIVDSVRQVSDKIAILIDTKGPEVRLSPTIDNEGIHVEKGSRILFKDGPEKYSSADALYTNCSTFVKEVPSGARILLDDASIELRVVSKTEEYLECIVCNKGIIQGKKGVNIPDVHMSLPPLTEKDKLFIRWAIESDIDFIAHSFVRSREDLIEIREMLDNAGSHIKIISKIENQQGIDNIEEILHESYGVMVARGDLGVEIAPERIPFIQKVIVEKCRRFRKPVIIATQMLHSMIQNPRPTRAEVTDVTNAILQGADAIMLSGETASGSYPEEAVETMRKIAEEAEKHIEVAVSQEFDEVLKPIAATLARNMVEASIHLPVKAIIFDTWTGRTGRYLAEFRPKVPIYAMCYRDFLMRELALVYGISSYRFDIQDNKDAMVINAIRILKDDGKIGEGDLVGFVGGSFNDDLGATYLEFRYIKGEDIGIKGE